MCADRRRPRTPLRVRAATVADLEPVASLFDQYRQFYGEPSDLPRARDFLAERLARRESVILVATDSVALGAAPLGFVQLYASFTSVATGRLWILNDLFVAPHARRLGVASALLDAAKRHAKRTNALRIELTTAHDNTAARRLYEAFAYREDRDFVTYRLAL